MTFLLQLYHTCQPLLVVNLIPKVFNLIQAVVQGLPRPWWGPGVLGPWWGPRAKPWWEVQGGKAPRPKTKTIASFPHVQI